MTVCAHHPAPLVVVVAAAAAAVAEEPRRQRRHPLPVHPPQQPGEPVAALESSHVVRQAPARPSVAALPLRQLLQMPNSAAPTLLPVPRPRPQTPRRGRQYRYQYHRYQYLVPPPLQQLGAARSERQWLAAARSG